MKLIYVYLHYFDYSIIYLIFFLANVHHSMKEANIEIVLFKNIMLH